MDNTKIEWTDTTWNPIRGCSMAKGSELGGCLNCYAAAVAARFSGDGMPYAGLARMTDNGPRWTGKIRVLSDADAGEPLTKPLRWQRPRLIFVNSMSDLFHEHLSFEDVDRIVAVMALARQHTFQVLTKRPERMAEYLASRGPGGDRHTIGQAAHAVAPERFDAQGGMWIKWPLPNVWWGVSCEDQRALDDRMPHVIRALPNMAVAWLSAEPLLGPLDLTRWLPHARDVSQTRVEFYPGLSWVVAGGESGPNARPMHPAWPTNIMQQCRKAGVPFLFKQWGNWLPVEPLHGAGNITPAEWRHIGLMDPDGMTRGRAFGSLTNDLVDRGDTWIVRNAGKKAAGRLLNGRRWDEYPEGTERMMA